MTQKHMLTDEDLSVLFHLLIDAIRADWGTKNGSGAINPRFSMQKLFDRVDRLTPGIFENIYRMNHLAIGGQHRLEGRETAKPCPTDGEVLAVLKWVEDFGFDRLPTVNQLVKDDPRFLPLMVRLRPDDKTTAERLTLSLQELTMQVFEKEQENAILQNRIRQGEITKQIAQAEAERLRAELERKAKRFQELAQTILADLDRLESTTKDEKTIAELADIRKQVNFFIPH